MRTSSKQRSLCHRWLRLLFRNLDTGYSRGFRFGVRAWYLISMVVVSCGSGRGLNSGLFQRGIQMEEFQALASHRTGTWIRPYFPPQGPRRRKLRLGICRENGDRHQQSTILGEGLHWKGNGREANLTVGTLGLMHNRSHKKVEQLVLGCLPSQVSQRISQILYRMEKSSLHL